MCETCISLRDIESTVKGVYHIHERGASCLNPWCAVKSNSLMQASDNSLTSTTSIMNTELVHCNKLSAAIVCGMKQIN